MKKIEAVKVFEAVTPAKLEKAYANWMVEKSAERAKNVAVNSLPFYADILSRTLLPIGDGTFSLAVFYHDYILEKHEAGGATHHPDEDEGASAIGPETRKQKRR